MLEGERLDTRSSSARVTVFMKAGIPRIYASYARLPSAQFPRGTRPCHCPLGCLAGSKPLPAKLLELPAMQERREHGVNPETLEQHNALCSLLHGPDQPRLELVAALHHIFKRASRPWRWSGSTGAEANVCGWRLHV